MTVVVIARLVLAAVFAVAGVTKLADRAARGRRRRLRRAKAVASALAVAPAARRAHRRGIAVPGVNRDLRGYRRACSARNLQRHDRSQPRTRSCARLPLLRTAALGAGELEDAREERNAHCARRRLARRHIVAEQASAVAWVGELDGRGASRAVRRGRRSSALALWRDGLPDPHALVRQGAHAPRPGRGGTRSRRARARRRGRCPSSGSPLENRSRRSARAPCRRGGDERHCGSPAADGAALHQHALRAVRRAPADGRPVAAGARGPAGRRRRKRGRRRGSGRRPRSTGSQACSSTRASQPTSVRGQRDAERGADHARRSDGELGRIRSRVDRAARRPDCCRGSRGCGACPSERRPPKLELASLDGEAVSLESLRGQETLLLFWNPECGFCRSMRDDVFAWEASATGGSPRLVVVSSGDAESTRAEGFESLVLLDEKLEAGTAFRRAGRPWRCSLVPTAGSRVHSPRVPTRCSHSHWTRSAPRDERVSRRARTHAREADAALSIVASHRRCARCRCSAECAWARRPGGESESKSYRTMRHADVRLQANPVRLSRPR